MDTEATAADTYITDNREFKAQGWARLLELWDSTKHVEILFEKMKKILEALVDMYGMATYITDDESIKAVYMGIQRSGKFTWDSEK